MIVKLSTGEEVHLSDRYTRKAQRAYNEALGVKYTENADGKLDVTSDIPLDNFNLADEAMLLCTVERIVNGSSEQPISQAWIDNIDAANGDFDKLRDGLMEIRKGKQDKKKS